MLNCRICDGCGKISDKTGTPWNKFVGSGDQISAEIDGALHTAKKCPRCNGVGVSSDQS